MGKIFRLPFLLGVSIFSFFSPLQAQIDTQKNAAILASSYKYFLGLKSGNSGKRIAVIYKNGIAKEKEGAENFASAIKEFPDAKSIGLTAVPLAHDQLASATDIGALYLYSGNLEEDPTIFENAQKQRVFVIGSSVKCAEKAVCILSITTDPEVKIFLNEKALHNYGFEVDPSFRFMVKSL